MAFSNFGYFNQSTSGAPALTTTNGFGNAFFHYALTTISNWTRTQHDAGNNRDVWQPGAGGSLPVLICKHNSPDSGDARLMVVRLAESASSTTAFTDPFPTVTQAADTTANWLLSTTASTTRDYHCVVWETGIVLFVRISGATDVWEVYFAGKAFSKYSGTDDPYPWVCFSRVSVAFTAAFINRACNTTIPSAGALGVFGMRNAQGTVKSELLYPVGKGTSWGNAGTNPAAAGAGYLGTFDAEKVTLHALASSTTTSGANVILNRLCIPQVYQGLHSGYAGLGEGDTMSNGSHSLLLLKSGNNGWLLETGNAFTGYPAG